MYVVRMNNVARKGIIVYVSGPLWFSSCPVIVSKLSI